MQNQPMIVPPERNQPALNVLGTKVTVLAANSATGGYEITLQSGDEGLGPPPHSHAWDESFYVIRGQVQFFCDGESMLCSAGTLVHVPGGTVHGFSYGPGGGEMLEVTSEGGQATAMFSALSHAIPPGPPDLGKVVSVLDSHGVTVHA